MQVKARLTLGLVASIAVALIPLLTFGAFAVITLTEDTISRIDASVTTEFTRHNRAEGAI